MSSKLYVGNLSDEATEDDLLYNFGDLGTCRSVKIIKDKYTGKSKGYAFVEMGSDEEAREVIKICKGVELDGKKLIVSEARPTRTENQDRGKSRPGKRK